jgi:hypothetical protein
MACNRLKTRERPGNAIGHLYRLYRKCGERFGSQSRCKRLRRRKKDWSGREDLNLRPPGPENGIRESCRMFSISYSGASTISVLLNHLILR